MTMPVRRPVSNSGGKISFTLHLTLKQRGRTMMKPSLPPAAKTTQFFVDVSICRFCSMRITPDLR